MTTALRNTLRHTVLGLALAAFTAVLSPEARSAEGAQVGVLSCESVEGGSWSELRPGAPERS